MKQKKIINCMICYFYNICKIMIGKPRKPQYENIPDLIVAIKQLANQQSYRYHQQFRLVVTSAIGVDDQKGLISTSIDYYLTNPPVNWVVEYDKLMTLLDPTAEFMKRLIANADSSANIEVRQIPKNVMEAFPEQGIYESRRLRGLKRQISGNFSLNLWEWFWVHVVNAFMGLNQHEERNGFKQQQNQDQFFTELSRNIYLAIIRKTMHFLTATNNRVLLERLLTVIQLFLIEELVFKFSAQAQGIKKSGQIKYRLRSHYFYLLYSLIHIQEGRLDEETVMLYYDYLLKIADNYSYITTLTGNQNIRNLIRVFVFLATRSVSLQKHLWTNLEHANQKEGWFKLERCPFDRFKDAIILSDIPLQQHNKVMTIRANIFRLLRKYNEWTPSFSFLANVQYFLIFDKQVLNRYQKIDDSQKNEQQIVSKCLERILRKLEQENGNQNRYRLYSIRLNNLINQCYGSEINYSPENQKIQSGRLETRSLSASSLQNQKHISYQSARVKNVWQYPIQQNQFYILYIISYWIAQKLDRLIPGHKNRQYPSLNLRIMCNPIVFFACVILLAVLLKYR